MADHKTEKTRLKSAIAYAQAHGYSLKVIAEESGVPYGTLRTFTTREHLGARNCLLLARWCKANKIPTDAPFIEVESARMSLAKDLTVLAELLANPDYSDEFVTLKLTSWIRVSYEGLPHIVKAIEKGGER